MIKVSIQLVTTFRKLAWLCLVCLLLPGCSQDFKAIPVYPSNVPAPLAKKWSTSRFPMRSFWEYNGSSSTTNESHKVIAFNFKPNGECEFYQVVGKNSLEGRTEELIFKKGTVQFHSDQSFTFYPTQGNKREFVKVCDNAYQNYNKNASDQDLTPQTFYYTYQPNKQGHEQLIIRTNKSTHAATNLVASNW